MSRINVEIVGIDRISNVIGSIRSNAMGLTSVFNGIGTGLGFGAAMAAISSLNGAVTALRTNLEKAGNQQVQALATASDISTNLGVNFEKAKGIVESTQVQISKAAASLPGVTSEYNEIFNSISGTIASQFKGQEKAFEQISIDITKRVGVLAAIRKADAGQAGSAVNRFLAGTMGFGEASLNDIFQKNPQLMQAIRDEAKKAGISLEKWKEQTNATRLAIVQAALKTATPDTLIKQFDNTYDSLIQNFQTKLFDPLVGVFGFLRKVESKSRRSVLDAATGYLQAFQGFSEMVSTIAGRLGLSVDPMAVIITVIDWFSDLTNSASEFLSKVKIPNLSGGIDFSSIISNITNTLGNFDTSGLSKKIGEVFNGILPWMNEAISNINWFDVGRLIGTTIFKIALFLEETLGAIDWGAFARGIFQLLFNIIGAIGQTLRGAIQGFARLMEGYIYDSTKGALDAIKSLWDRSIQALRDAIQWVQNLLNPSSIRPSGASPVIAGQQALNAVSGVISNPVGAVSGVVDKAKELGGNVLKQLPIPGVTNNTSTKTQAFNPVVNINGANMDGEKLANLVMDRLNNLYQQQYNSVVA